MALNLSFFILKKLKENAEGYFSEKIKSAHKELKEALQNPLQEDIEIKMKNLSEIIEDAHKEYQNRDRELSDFKNAIVK